MNIRVRYSKHGKVRFLSHRDLARVFERAVRRAGLPVAYSQGFTPRPRLQFGLALSTGYVSDAEFLDVGLEPQPATDVEFDGVATRLNECLPVGIVVTAVELLEPGEPSLQDAVTSCAWQFELSDIDPVHLSEEARRLLDAAELPVDLVRKGKQVREDLRPLLINLSVEPLADGARLHAELGTKPRSVRPAELLIALGLDEHAERVLRTHQWITTDGGRREPIELDPSSPHASERAS